MTGPLISTAELADALDSADLHILDASWHLDGPDAARAFQHSRIPGARFFDLDAVSDRDSPLPHMLPSPAAFAALMGALGLSETDDIVVYDSLGLFSAARAWWMLTTMGARNVRVLDGGLPMWRAEGRLLRRGPAPRPTPAVFRARMNPGAIVSQQEVARALLDEAAHVLDARSTGRFSGAAPEPRLGLRCGHMPGAANLPFGALLTPEGKLKPAPELAAVFADAGLSEDQTAVTTCGSGVTAAILSLALAALGRGSRLYDGSWAEWGTQGGGPVVTDSAPRPD